MAAPLDILAGVVAAAAPHLASSSSSKPRTHPAPPPMLAARIPHLAGPPPSPPSDVTTSTAGVGGGEPKAPVPKRHKVRVHRGKRPFEAASHTAEQTDADPNQSPRQRQRLAQVQERKDVWGSEKSADADVGHATSGKSDERRPDGKVADDDSQDNKRAMRAERNRQSAAASRERKKRHIKDLEDRVKYLTELNNTMQYRLDVQKRRAEEKEIVLHQEIARLRHQLTRESAFRASPPQNHPMTLHHLTHQGPVTY